jgi:hypothetical protein
MRSVQHALLQRGGRRVGEKSLVGLVFFGLIVPVGMRLTTRPPDRSVRAAFPHTAPTLGI